MSSQRPGQRTTITFSDSDYDLFQKAVEAESAESILQWLLTAGRKRAKLVTQPGPLIVTEVIVNPPEGVKVTPKEKSQ